MSTPAWILEIVGAVMILIAEASAGQLMAARAWTRGGGTDADLAVSLLLTGIALAGLLVPGLSILPSPAWEAVFSVSTAWFIWCLLREGRDHGAAAVTSGHYAPHLLHSAAMLYLFAAATSSPAAGAVAPVPGMSGMPGMSGGSSGGAPTLPAPTLALIFALLLIALTVYDLDRRADADGYFHVVGGPVAPAGPAPPGPAPLTAAGLLLSPAVVKGCQVATSTAIAFTLIIMI